MTIENDVSTRSATAACVRDLRLEDLDVLDGDPERPLGDAVPAWRSTALVSVRVTFHGSVSPNAHGRVDRSTRRPRLRDGCHAAVPP